MATKEALVRVLLFLPAEAHAQYYYLKAHMKNAFGEVITHKDVYLRGLRAYFDDLGLDPKEALSVFHGGVARARDEEASP